tara:strand:- start:187 stop:1050 length:864 start_codon:yes stop_codon:yes gene_type:complete
MPSKIISTSIKESFLVIPKNKKIFTLVFVLQILFFLSILVVSSYYTSKILENTEDIIDYTETLNLNIEQAKFDILQQKNPLGEDPLLISRNYEEMKKNSLFLLLSVFIIFVIINGLIWYLTSNFQEKNKKVFSIKNIITYLSKFLIISLILSSSLFILVYNFLNISFSSFLSTKPMNFIPLIIIAIITIYFSYIAIPLLSKKEQKKKSYEQFKKFIKNVLSIGTKKFIPIIISYLIILSLIALPLVLIFYSIELNLMLLFIEIILLLFIFVWIKIFFVIVVKKLSSF